jgi:hypothetical protein
LDEQQLSYFNDLWQFDPSTNGWTWMGGSSTIAVNTGCGAAYRASPPRAQYVGNAAVGYAPGGLWLGFSRQTFFASERAC